MSYGFKTLSMLKPDASHLFVAFVSLVLLSGCQDTVWNNPYPADAAAKPVFYSSFSERPKHLDPARSYSSNEWAFISQVYEPPLQYHFFKRPYALVPLTSVGLPQIRSYDAQGQLLDETAPADKVAYTDYLVEIQPGIRYQPHPAFAQDDNGNWRYWPLNENALQDKHQLADFEHMDSRELTAADYIYQIKRLAFAANHSPIAGLMSDHIRGFAGFSKQVEKAYKAQKARDGDASWFDLRTLDMTGVQQIDRYRYRIRIEKKYPQFIYWLAMNFFAPMPWEAERFYQQAGMKERNITLNWYPVGTGPFVLAENNPNLRMVLARNPNFHGETYPAEGSEQDRKDGLLADAGKNLPLIDKAVYSLEKEAIPRWNKFLQGYFDNSGIGSDSFDQAVQFGGGGEATLTPAMQDKGIQLNTAVETSVFYTGFNMRDDVVGGDSERSRLLRRAIAIAMDMEEYISIFRNGRGEAAQSPLPQGIFGYRAGEAGINPYIYEWRNGKAQRRGIEEARALLAKAGYVDGRDPKTGGPLILNYDTPATGPDAKAMLQWYVKQLDKLGIRLVIRGTDYNRFQDKMLKGTSQMFSWGWNADYPDPENFLFLLYGPNGKVEQHGENAANYANAEFDRLFAVMKDLPNGEPRQQVLDQMIEILRRDSPWIFGFFPKAFSLHHAWYKNAKPHLMANNTLKYKRIQGPDRQQSQQRWNEPVTWPLWLFLVILLVSILPAIKGFRQHERSQAK